MTDLTKKSELTRLPRRKEPYWMRLGTGRHLGYRAGPGTWIAKYRSHDGKRECRSLIGANSFDEAKVDAEKWFAQLSGSPFREVKRATVREALEAYLDDLRRHSRYDAALDAEWRFNAYVYGDRLADLKLERVTRDDFLEWRDRARAARPQGRKAPVTRQDRTINRQVRAVVAGLNRALELGYLGNPSAWKMRHLSDEREDDETAVFLTPEQRRLFIACCEPHAAAFFRGLELTGARPKELASARVEDFDGRQLRLAHKKGRPAKLRVRHVVLSEEGIAHLKRAASSKLPKAYLFTEDGEQPWRRHKWARAFRAAADVVNQADGRIRIPDEASAYSFRHARISELLQVHGVDPLTIAVQCGTSLSMIEKAYHRFIPAALREKLAAVRDSNV